MSKFFASFLSLILLFSINAHADDIYRWEDSRGRIHYSTKRPSPDSKPVDLPELGRENLQEKIDALREQAATGCESHGGVDCQCGPDDDGSVICVDGYRDAKLPFRFACMETNVNLASLWLKVEGSIIPLSRLSEIELTPEAALKAELIVEVRNASAVSASDVYVGLRVGRDQIDFTGPDGIGAYAAGEYSLSLAPFAAKIGSLGQGMLEITCRNCR